MEWHLLRIWGLAVYPNVDLGQGKPTLVYSGTHFFPQIKNHLDQSLRGKWWHERGGIPKISAI